MAERSPIFSAKNGSRQIGYIEGNEAFDLLGRWRCRFNEKTGNLCDPNGKIVGHLSLERKFVGVSWIADELFPKPDAASIEASANSLGEPIALDPTETSSLSDHDAVVERALEAIRMSNEPVLPKSDAATSEASINSSGEPIALDPTETSSLSDHDAVVERALEAIRIALAKKSKDHQ